MRSVYGLGGALKKAPLTIDDAFRSAGGPGGKNHARGLIHAELRGAPALPRGWLKSVQLNYAHCRRKGLDGFEDILLCEDQGGPGIQQYLAQPVARIMWIQGDKRASRRQASQYRDGKQRT